MSEIRTVGAIAEVQVDKNLRVTRVWTKVSKAKAATLMAKRYKGRPLYETRDPNPPQAADESARRVFGKVAQRPSEAGDTEDDS